MAFGWIGSTTAWVYHPKRAMMVEWRLHTLPQLPFSDTRYCARSADSGTPALRASPSAGRRLRRTPKAEHAFVPRLDGELRSACPCVLLSLALPPP